MPLDFQELDGRVKKLRKGLKGFPKNPAISEVHDLRTRTRRVESILHALAMDSSAKENKLLKGLKAVRSRAGKVRDMDVFTSYIVGLGLKDDPDCVVRLVHHLGRERYRSALKLHSTVQKNAPGLRQNLKRQRGKLEKALERFAHAGFELDSPTGADQADAPLHAVTVALRLSEELARVKRLGRDNLHPYRIELKRLRYLLEMVEADERSRNELIDALKRAQNAIGEWHDWLELAGIAQKILRDHKSCRLVKKIGETAERKFGEALRVTEQMRRRYLLRSPSRSKKPARGRAEPVAISEPVLVAASEIAA
jgi:CHAD domain-containing protein